MNFALLIFVVPLAINNDVVDAILENDIHKYFTSDLYKEFSKAWHKYKPSYENTIKKTLQETFGHKSVNVFSQYHDEPLFLSEGLYFDDCDVGVLLQNLTLRALPFLRQPDVTFDLPDHYLQVDAGLSKIIIDASYTVFRNRSSIVYTAHTGRDWQEHSLFRSAQVHTTGLLTFVATGCHLNGDTIATLSGTLVDLLQHEFKVHNCDFFVEIYRPGTGNPPVMSPFFSRPQGAMIQQILTPTISSELMKHLEGAVIATVNTTAIFGSDLMSRIRPHQKEVIRKAALHLRNVVSRVNLLTRQRIEGSLRPSPLRITWDDCEGQPCMNEVIMDNMTLYGLDSAYCGQQGGPIQNPVIRISDMIKFSTMQVRGDILWKDDSGGTYENSFMLDMHDVTIAIKLSMVVQRRQSATLKALFPFDVLGWRKEKFSILNAGPTRYLANSLAIGYLNEEVPRLLINDFYSIYLTVADKGEDPKNDPSLLDSVSGDEMVAHEKISDSVGEDEKAPHEKILNGIE